MAAKILPEVCVGDTVIRYLAGEIRMPLKVTVVTDILIICGGTEIEHIGWWFDRRCGAEVDEDLGWGPPPKHTGSFILVDERKHERR